MQHYIVEVWRCENGHLLFEPLPTNELSVTFIDQPGCSSPRTGASSSRRSMAFPVPPRSHGRHTR